MEFVSDLTLLSCFTFTNKEKTKQFFKVQVLASWKDYQGLKNKLIELYVDSDVYAEVSAMEIGSKIPVVHTVNYATDSITYSIK